ncbi:Protein kinase-like domain protein [Niveomyces insectorum RCEF 264]|uniref:Autophagy-related protein 1 n=1 Tax=Niveomyces insectorum RCEF 264 TaxID=1081102 RepID=A0A167YYZ9_9HYPO|nr:Protein kinase-like domain protein [Niveomyces insectorum RCEF 264]
MAEDSIICVIEGSEWLTEAEHNERFVWDEARTYEEDVGDSQQPNSVREEHGTPAPNWSDPAPVLRITTKHKPKAPELGFLFGRDANTCDVLLNGPGISDWQFAIQINWRWGTIVLKNYSRHGTRVSMHLLKEDVQLKSTRLLHHFETVEAWLGGNVHVCIKRYNDPTDWADYCRTQWKEIPSLAQFNFEPAIETTNASRRPAAYVQGKRLGKGAYAQVYQAIDKYTGQVFAMKLYDKPRQARWQEPQILESLRHRHIVQYISYSRLAHGPAELIMEYVKGPTLHDVLESSNGYPALQTTQVRDLLRQLLRAVGYLHDHAVTHRDLKPANIMIAQQEPIQIKLVDFGEATSQMHFDTFCGTPAYSAPEVVERRNPCSNKVDVFSVGVIALELLFGLPKPPDVGRARERAPKLWLNAILQKRTSLVSLATTAAEFVCRMLSEDPNERPSASESLDHRYFHDVLPVVRPTEQGPPPESRANIPPTAGLVPGFCERREGGEHVEGDPYAYRNDVHTRAGAAADVPDTASWSHSSVYSEAEEASSSRRQTKRHKRTHTASENWHEEPNNVAGPSHPNGFLSDGSEESDTEEIYQEDEIRDPEHAGREGAPSPGTSLSRHRRRQLLVGDRVVSLRENDHYLNILELCAAAKITNMARLKVVQLLQDRGVVSQRHGQPWVPYEDGCFLAQRLGLDLQPLLLDVTEDGVDDRHAGGNNNRPWVPDLRGNYLLLPRPLPRAYRVLWWHDEAIVYVPRDQTVNATQLVRALGLAKGRLQAYLSRHPSISRTVLRAAGGPQQGTYMPLQDAQRLCRVLGLDPEPVQTMAEACGLDLCPGTGELATSRREDDAGTDESEGIGENDEVEESESDEGNQDVDDVHDDDNVDDDNDEQQTTTAAAADRRERHPHRNIPLAGGETGTD